MILDGKEYVYEVQSSSKGKVVLVINAVIMLQHGNEQALAELPWAEEKKEFPTVALQFFNIIGTVYIVKVPCGYFFKIALSVRQFHKVKVIRKTVFAFRAFSLK